MTSLDEAALAVLFTDARTHSDWKNLPVDLDVVRRAIALAGLAPTAANTQPARYVMVVTPEGKARLKPFLAPGNVEKTMAAPVTVILGMDYAFYEDLPRMFPQTDAKSWYAGNPSLIEETAFRNASLQGGYFLLAARALGLDCGPMSGFDADGVTKAFFAGTDVRANFLC
ncbi:MAG: malonic semialdehyde reductase, partial [Rhodospirillaceae bacterium]|nr:malonic semialdehyde reductase [Rhodospirillaceae bacterium]